MPRLRRLALLASVGVGSAALAGPAFGARPTPVELPFTIATPHFVVHFQSDKVNSPTYAITQTTAGDIAAGAERAYSAELADGYAAPVADGALGGDARLDIYVMDLTASGALGLTVPDNPAGAQSSSYIELDGTQPELAFSQHTIAHEFFHTIQLGIWQPQLASDYWLLEGSAEWMGYRVDGYNTSIGLELGPNDLALDCRDSLGTNMCDLSDDYKNNGYARWPFFEYVAEKYGSSFVSDVFSQGAAGAGGIGAATAALSSALVAKGTTLADTYNAWTQADLIGGYSVKALQGVAPTVVSTVRTGIDGGSLGTVKIPVNHLSTRIIEFDRGNNDASHVCYIATLSISVAMPAGTQSKPVFWWNAEGNPPVALTINGNTASAAIPWDTCTYTSTKGFLVLPNASVAVDAADFVVSTSLSIDPTKPTTPSNPPKPIFVPTPVIPVTSADVAPTLFLFGPAILKLSAKDVQIRLIVESNGPGSVQAKLGSFALGTVTLRGGNNDLRFKLPSGALAKLRRSASASNVLTLTPVSSNGSATGQSVTRTVRVAPAKPKPKQKSRRK